FAPWLNRATNVVVGGRFSPESWYGAIDELNITIWYSAPTALRMMMGAGDEVIKQYDLSSLRHVLSVGEPLNPEVVIWWMFDLGFSILVTWWTTDTGADMVTNVAAMDIKAGSMGKPVPGAEAAIIDDEGNELPANRMGNLGLKSGWPAMMREVWKNKPKYD